MNERTPSKPLALLVTRNLPPLRGGMERLNQHIAMELAVEYHLQVIGPSGSRSGLPDDIEVSQAPCQSLWRFFLYALFRTWRLAYRHSPSLAVAGSGLTAPFAVLAARLAGGRSAVYAHGLDLVAPHPIYRAIWLPLIRRCDVCIVNSRNTARLAREAGVPPERIAILHPGVRLPPERELPGASESFRRKHNLQDASILLSVGRLTARKGLIEFVKFTLPTIIDRHPEAVLVVIGDEASDALQGGGTTYGHQLLEYARKQGLADHVRMLGVCDDDDLAAAYYAADLNIFPVRETPNDVEGFGMVAIEAAAHGLATVAFDVGGISDAIAHGESGCLAQPGDYGALSQCILTALAQGRTSRTQQQCRRFAESFAWPLFDERLRTLLRPQAHS